MTDAAETAGKIASCCGGIHNILRVSCCATRIRLRLKDISLFNKSAVELIPAVRGVLYRGEEIHLVCGLEAAVYYRELQSGLS